MWEVRICTLLIYMHDFFRLVTKWGRGKDSIRMLFNQVCCLFRLPLFHWKVEEISCHSSCAFCTGTLRTQRFPLEIKDDEMSKAGIGVRNVWTCWYFGKDTTIWNHWSCSIDTRLHRRKCEVLLSSWLCDPRSDVECAIGCNEGRTLQEGPAVFEVFCCCSAQRWENIFYLESGFKRASTQLFLVKVRFVFGLAKEVVFFSGSQVPTTCLSDGLGPLSLQEEASLEVLIGFQSPQSPQNHQLTICCCFL